jgi:hypothetical protein
MRRRYSCVISVKAGIQYSVDSVVYWIPAFAEMRSEGF